MGVYIDSAYLREVVGDQTLYEVLGHRFRGSTIDLAGVSELAAINRAIAEAEGAADAKLGRRFTAAQLESLDELGHGEAIKGSVARMALYNLAPLAMPISEQISKAYDRACSMLSAIGKGELAAGRDDPHPPPTHTGTVDTIDGRGLVGMMNF